MEKSISRTVSVLGAFLLLLFLVSCSEKVESPFMEYDYVYFTEAIKGPEFLSDGDVDNGIPEIVNYLGFVEKPLDFTKDSMINLGIYCSGTQMPEGDVTVTISIDETLIDSLSQYATVVDSVGNIIYPDYDYTDYQLLSADKYTIDNLTVIIPEGSSMTYLPVLLKTSQIDPTGKYILPLRITGSTLVEISPDHNKLLFYPKSITN